ncbi:prepilin-type N-terminal cleavage/methylation domain-containing protein [Oscillospiraceae bacterium WX1]
MKRNRKGFTLVEMLVSFAILGILLVMITLIIQNGSVTYNAVSSDINLQYESQNTMSQLENYIIDCNEFAAVSTAGDRLYLINDESDGTYTVNAFAYDASSKTLQFYKTEGITTLNTDDPNLYALTGSAQPMSSYVTSLTADIAPDNKSITVTLSYALGSKSYTGSQTVAFRNIVASKVIAF